METEAVAGECPNCKVLREEIEQWRARVVALEKQVEELKRASYRQAAPFRIPEDKRKPDPKRPGRKPGHKGAYRERPERIDEKVEVPLLECPLCGDQIASLERVEQYIEEVPEAVRPRVTHLITYRGYCRRCDKDVASRHPLQVSGATGAAGTHVGPRALALTAELRHAMGLTVRQDVPGPGALLRTACDTGRRDPGDEPGQPAPGSIVCPIDPSGAQQSGGVCR